MDTTSFIESDIREAAQKLMQGFSWHQTPQGVEYWKGVYSNLHALADAKAVVSQ